MQTLFRPDSKSGVPQGTVGSNPTFSASECKGLLLLIWQQTLSAFGLVNLLTVHLETAVPGFVLYCHPHQAKKDPAG